MHIFSGKPWHYIIRGSKGYTFEFQKTEVDTNGIKKQPSADRRRFEDDEETDDPSILTMLAAQILFIFKKAADRSFRKDPAFTQACFLELILRIIVAQDKENRNQSTSAQHLFIKLEIQYDWIVAAIKSVISSTNLSQPSLVEQLTAEGGQDLGSLSEDKKQMLIDVLQAVEIQPAHIDEVIEMIQTTAQQTSLARVKVQLLESKHDYVQALLLYMNNEMLRRQLFKWLFDTMDKLTKKDYELRRAKESASTSMAFGGKGKRKYGPGGA